MRIFYLVLIALVVLALGALEIVASRSQMAEQMQTPGSASPTWR